MIPPMQPNKSMSSLESFRTKRPLRRRRAVHCVLTSVVLVSAVTLTVLCATIVREYALSRDYESASCLVLNSTYDDEDGECLYCAGSIEKGKDRSACVKVPFPCLRVHVQFASTIGRVRGQGLLYSDTVQASIQHVQCSYSAVTCYESRAENAAAVDRYSRRFPPQRTFPCYYDTDTRDNVIAHKVYTKSDVIHCILWPSVIILACISIFIYVEFYRPNRSPDNCPHQQNGSHPHGKDTT